MVATRQVKPSAPVIEEAGIQALRARLRGQLMRTGDDAYEMARHVYNAMIDKHPQLIAHCVDVADVMACVNFAREHKLTIRTKKK